MPFWLIRNTRPLDCRAPRIALGSPPVTRLRTWLAELLWMKRVTSPAPMEKLFQSITVPLALVTVSTLAPPWNVALPATTVGLRGLASASEEKPTAMASEIRVIARAAPGTTARDTHARRTCGDDAFTDSALEHIGQCSVQTHPAGCLRTVDHLRVVQAQ